MTDTSAEGMDDCELCGGSGEVEATTQRAERDTVGCPACIQREATADLAAARAERDEARVLLARNEGRVKEIVDEQLLKRAEAAELKLAGVYEECAVIAERAAFNVSRPAAWDTAKECAEHIASTIRQRAGRG